LVKEFFLRRMGDLPRRDAHGRAATYWAGRQDALEEVYHRIESGDLATAAARLVDVGPAFAESARAGDLESGLLRVPRDSKLDSLLVETQMFLGKFADARAVLERIAASGTPAERLRAHIQLGRIANRLASYADARSILAEAVREAAIQINLGIVSSREGDARTAAETFARSAEIALGAGDVRFASYALANAVDNFLRLDAVEAAAASAERAVQLAQTIGDPVALSTAKANLGLVFAKRGEWTQAEAHLLESVEMIARLENPYSLATRYEEIARLYETQGRRGDAAPWRARADDLFARLQAGGPTRAVGP